MTDDWNDVPAHPDWIAGAEDEPRFNGVVTFERAQEEYGSDENDTVSPEPEQERKPLGMKDMKRANFTPNYDFLLQYPNGKAIADVFGKIARYCMMDREQVEVSQVRIARELGMGITTLKVYMDWLEKNGLIYDTTPLAGKEIHYYKVNVSEFNRQATAFEEAKFDFPPMQIIEA